MRGTVRLGLLLALLITLAGCTASATGQTFDLVEWDIAGPGRLSADTGSVHVTNSGTVPHTLVVTDASGQVVAATDLVSPGESVDLDIDLEPGRYSFTCRIVAQSPEGEIVDHYESGMNTMVDVSG